MTDLEDRRIDGLPRVVLLSRIAHGIVSAVFISCIVIVYAAAWSGRINGLAVAAVVALCCEGLLIALSRGNCPLAPVFRRLGDDTPFFELVIPRRAAAFAVPVLSAVTVIGIVLLALRAT